MVDVSAKEVADQIQKMHDLGLIIWYEVDGERYIQLVSWWKRQPLRFAHTSKFPPPENWKDRLRFNDPSNPKRLIEENWTSHVPIGRPKKSDSESPIQDPYISDLYRPPTQDGEIHPSASAIDMKDPLPKSPDSGALRSAGKDGNFQGKGIGQTPGEDEAFFCLWNRAAVLLPKARELNATRRRKIRARLRDRTISEWGEIFQRMNASPFLRGEIGAGTFRADFDWIIANEGNAVKVLEGRYDNRGASKRSSPENASPTGTAGRTLEIL